MKIRVRHVRHRRSARVQKALYFKNWLSAQGTRLTLTAKQVLENLLVTQEKSAAIVEAQLP